MLHFGTKSIWRKLNTRHLRALYSAVLGPDKGLPQRTLYLGFITERMTIRGSCQVDSDRLSRFTNGRNLRKEKSNKLSSKQSTLDCPPKPKPTHTHDQDMNNRAVFQTCWKPFTQTMLPSRTPEKLPHCFPSLNTESAPALFRSQPLEVLEHWVPPNRQKYWLTGVPPNTRRARTLGFPLNTRSACLHTRAPPKH